MPAHASGDDYPYRGLGQCPLVPLPPKPPATHTPGKPGGPHKPGGPQKPDKPVVKKPAPPRECAKHIWFYNGSYGDPWGFALRNCTSFVAWRLRETNGLDAFENHFGGVHWGNAEHWDEAASALGYRVDDVPAIGAVAQTDDGRVGHVAWVSAIGDGTVTVEEYNHSVAGGYGVRTVPTTDFRYLHLEDVAPSPYLGSTRAGVATSDAHEGTWTARVSADGDLTVQRPSGRTVRLGHHGQWSAYAAPAVVTDSQGRVWVAAVTAVGRVLAGHTSPQAMTFSRLGQVLASATTASPALVVDGQGRVRVLATNAAGTLFERHTHSARSDRWSRPDRRGVRGSWSTHSAPSAVTDILGATWVAAVTRGGALLVQHTTHAGARWTGMHRLDHRPWSVTSTPALTAGWDGRVWLATVDDRGALLVRHTQDGAARWQRPDQLPGQWSPYSSPSLTLDRNGRTWLASVSAGGRLAVRSLADDGRKWQASRGVPTMRNAETESPGLTASVNGVLVGVDRHGRMFWRRPLGPDEQLPAAHGPHGGGFSMGRYL